MNVEEVLKHTLRWPKRITAERKREIMTLCLAQFGDSLDNFADIENRLFYTSPEVINQNLFEKREKLIKLRDDTKKDIQKRFVKYAKDNFTDIKQANTLFESLVHSYTLIYNKQNKRYIFTI